MTTQPLPPRLIDRDKVWALFCDHYWDSFQRDRDLILSHINAVLMMTPEAADGADGETNVRDDR